MVSKNRMSVNFSSETMYKQIQRLAIEHNISQSRIIESILEKHFYNDPTNATYADLDWLYSDAALYVRNRNKTPGNIYIKDLLSNTVKLNNGRRCIINATPLARIPFRFECKHSDVLEWRFEFKKFIPKRSKLNEMLLGEIKLFDEEFLAMLPSEPDLLHVMLSEINVNITMNTDASVEIEPHERANTVTINVVANLFLLPVFRHSEHTPNKINFDFINLHYRLFRAVAQEGWNRAKYSHLICVKEHPEPTVKSGGFFVGLCYENPDWPLEPPKGMHQIRNCFIKHHIPSIRMKVTTTVLNRRISSP